MYQKQKTKTAAWSLMNSGGTAAKMARPSNSDKVNEKSAANDIEIDHHTVSL